MPAVHAEPAFVLHRRPYRNTSLLLDLFTLNHGKVSCIARGARSLKNRQHGLLQPFSPLLASWVGHSSLVTLSGVEAASMPYQLQGSALFSGFYLNELLLKLCEAHDPHPNLYHCYQASLAVLGSGEAISPYLRHFEKQLLQEAGYGFALNTEYGSGVAIHPEHRYQFYPEFGFTRSSDHKAYQGEHLLAMAEDDYFDPSIADTAKRIYEQAIRFLLEGRKLQSLNLV